ncbi:MAG: hypothetical protein ACP5Q5_10875 [Brevinematia bacterium]
MKSLLLKCSLPRCNVDGTKEMNIDKCVLNNSSPCYYLIIKDEDGCEPEEVWKKFDNFVLNKSKKS